MNWVILEMLGKSYIYICCISFLILSRNKCLIFQKSLLNIEKEIHTPIIAGGVW